MIIPESIHQAQSFRKAELISLPGIGNSSGRLNYWDNKRLFPNGILRCFWITGVNEGAFRGSHAHYLESQVLVALSGILNVRVEGLDQSLLEFELTNPDQGLFIPPMNWVEVEFKDGAVLLGMSDREFSEKDYIRDKSEFGSLQKRHP